MREGAAGAPPPGSDVGANGGGGGGGGTGGRNRMTLIGGVGGRKGTGAALLAIRTNTARCAAVTPTAIPAVRRRFFVSSGGSILTTPSLSRRHERADAAKGQQSFRLL